MNYFILGIITTIIGYIWGYYCGKIKIFYDIKKILDETRGASHMVTVDRILKYFENRL